MVVGLLHKKKWRETSQSSKPIAYRMILSLQMKYFGTFKNLNVVKICRADVISKLTKKEVVGFIIEFGTRIFFAIERLIIFDGQ